MPRGGVSDFFVKDYELSAYDPGREALRRERRAVLPDDHATGALGGVAGAFAGGRLRAWLTSAAGMLDGLGGATIGHALVEAEQQPPLPERYKLFALALPIVATDPNKGPTYGLLPVGVLSETERITNIFAPAFTFNEIDGVGGMFRMRRSFSKDSSLDVDAGTSTEGNDDYEVIYRQRRIGPNRFLYYVGRFAYRTQLSERFYGFGNGTEEDAETTYVLRRTLGEAAIGLELPLHLSLELRERLSSYKVGPGRLEDVPSTRRVFPGIDGVREGRLTILTHQVRLVFDNRDARGAPSRGLLAEFTYEIADETLGSDVDFQRFGLSASLLIPKLDDRLITCLRVGGWIMTGNEIPFYELTSVGGKHSHRGFGRGRFVDQNGYVASVEERVNLLRYRLAGKNQVLQVAGFVDVGRVLEKGEFTLKNAKVAAGAAVRLILPDSDLVTSIDVGISNEGPAVFVGLGYPY